MSRIGQAGLDRRGKHEVGKGQGRREECLGRGLSHGRRLLAGRTLVPKRIGNATMSPGPGIQGEGWMGVRPHGGHG